MTERQFQSAILDLAARFSWTVAHFRTAMNARGAYMTPVAADGKGFPDLVLVHAAEHKVMFREVKSDVGRLSPDQRAWLNTLSRAGADTAVWRPRDWPTIVQTLTFGRGT